jgi:hypothetical protein
MKTYRPYRLLLMACMLLLPALPLHAQPSGTIILTVHGPAGARKFSLADLEAIGLQRVTTRTFWPDDDGTYEGPLLAEVLKRAGIENTESIRIRARDGFSQIMPRQDWQKWPVLLATRRDGKPMSPRAKGPLRVIYPRDMAPELSDPVYRLRWVWLVESIEPVRK